MAQAAHLCQMLVYTLLSFQDTGEIKKQLDWWVGCQNFSLVSIMQLNIASPFSDKFWNISRNHTSFFPRWSNTTPNLSKKYQFLFISMSNATKGSLISFAALQVQYSDFSGTCLNHCLQILFSLSDSLWIWRIVPKMATHPVTSKHSDHTAELHLNSYFFLFLPLNILYHSR